MLVKFHYLNLCLFMLLWLLSGCDVPLEQSQKEGVPGNLKIDELKDPSQDTSFEENLISFKVLTYVAGPEIIDEIADLCNRLPSKDIRFSNKRLFQYNGFIAASADFSQGAAITRRLSQIGAVRIALNRLIIPANVNEVFYRSILQVPEDVQFSDSNTLDQTATFGPGFLGWNLMSKPDPRFRQMVQVQITPVYLHQGQQQSTIVQGREQTNLQFLTEGQLLVRLAEGNFIVLGPGRDIPDENTLDKRLFYLPGTRPKIRFFIIVCESVEY